MKVAETDECPNDVKWDLIMFNMGMSFVSKVRFLMHFKNVQTVQNFFFDKEAVQIYESIL